ncbi:MAG: AarF/UbiB family protein [Micropruina sp.]
MSIFSSEFGRDAHRAREILAVFSRYGILDRIAHQASGTDGGHGVAAGSADPDLTSMSSGQRLCAALAELGTSWIKLGQSLSMRADLVGAEVAHALEGLQTSVPTDAPGLARARVERELGKPVDQLFATFDDEAFASGSVAQAHHAVMLDGTEVVVKVLHDGTAEQVAGDLSLMGRLAEFAERVDPDIARYRPSVIVAKFAAMMRQATDLRNELQNMRRIAGALADQDWLLVPKAYPELCTAGVLTMESMSGKPMKSRDDVEAAGWSVDAMHRMVTKAWLSMIFEHGFYHADPHPGNFLLADPEHLVLLDFGDVGFLSGGRRDDVARLLLAVTSRDVAGLTDVLLQICEPATAIDTHALESAVDEWLAVYLPAGSGTADRDLNGAMSAGMQLLHQFELSFPSDLALLLRVMARLEGFGKQLGSGATIDDELAPFIKDFMAQEYDPTHLAQRAGRALLAFRQVARDLPRDLIGILGDVRSGKARVEVNLRDADEVSDKLVDGLMAAAALLAAGQLLSRETPPKVKGVSVLGVVAAGFSAVTWSRLASRRAGHLSLDQRVVRLVRRQAG